ncbi:VWA domain-containing protein [candidate division KSB1 bacterium]|nr:VWA domain-containing protein [candidate division KSB1 bacterium]
MTLFAANRLQLLFAGNSLVLLILMVLAAALTVFVYRRTNPVVSRRLRLTLIILRTLALWLLLLVLFQATVGRMREIVEKPIVAVLVDQSASMAVHPDRREQLVQSLAQIQALPAQNMEILIYGFGSRLQSLENIAADSLQLTDDATDITGALENLRSQLGSRNLTTVAILSDGNYTRGGNPARHAGRLGVPIISIPIGSVEEMPDIALAKIEANAFAYSGETTPIRIEISNRGFLPQRLTATLKEDGSTVAAETVELPGAPSQQEAVLRYTPTRPGRFKLVIELPSLEGEETTLNNRRTIYIDVFKSRLQVSILAGSAMPDVGFLRQHFMRDERYAVQTMVESSSGRYLGGHLVEPNSAFLDQTDLLILFNWPTRQTAQKLIERVVNAVSNRPLSLLLIAGPESKLDRLQEIETHLPVHARSRPISESTLFARLTPEGSRHPITAGNDAENIDWNRLPPLLTAHREIVPWPDSKVLLVATGDNRTSAEPETNAPEPLLVVRQSDLNKSAALMAHASWRWHLMMAGLEKSISAFVPLVDRLARWLEIEHNDKNVRLQADKALYAVGDPVVADVQIVDNRRRPLDADVNITVYHNNRHLQELATDRQQTGRFEKTIYPDRPGDYMLIAIAHREGRLVGRDTTRITVGETADEMLQTRLNLPLLASLAEMSRGRILPPDSLQTLPNIVSGRTRSHFRLNEWELAHHPIVLSLGILLLTAEWLLRKLYGML